jgi:class 3 adenylate cyclase
MDELPASVTRRLQELIYGDRAGAWLRIEAGLAVGAAGGALDRYGLGALRTGEAVLSAAPFLEGLLPLLESPLFLPSVEVADGRAADLHFHQDDDAVWLVLLDATSETDAARRMQQKAYDMTLAQEREARLNRELAAAKQALEVAHEKLRVQADELAAWNRTLESRVKAQVEEIERIGRLKRFLAPAVAEAIVASGKERILESHRRDIATLFCDLRGFTAFVESAEPEEVMELLQHYHSALVPLVQASEGTLDQFVGDGMLVYFNDPLPCPNPAERAVRLAIAMRDAMAELAETWLQRGYQIGFGVGIAQGFATLGQIGVEGRLDYTAVGTVINTAARLCDAAKNGQILVTSRIATVVANTVELTDIGQLSLKGLSRPLAVSNVTALKGRLKTKLAASPSPGHCHGDAGT